MELQIKMLHGMISENPDATIKDFLELLGEIERIETAAKIRLPVKVQQREQNGRFGRNIWIV